MAKCKLITYHGQDTKPLCVVPYGYTEDQITDIIVDDAQNWDMGNVDSISRFDYDDENVYRPVIEGHMGDNDAYTVDTVDMIDIESNI